MMQIDSKNRQLAQLAAHWHAPWLITLMSQEGRRHYREGDPCQDAHIIMPLQHGVLLAVADGVSSQTYSGEGARAAVQVLGLSARQHLDADAAPRRVLELAFDAAHSALAHTATEARRDIIDYACTLAAVLLTPSVIAAAAIGDSSIAALVTTPHEGAQQLRLSPLCSPPRRKGRAPYLITDQDWRQHLAVSEHPVDQMSGVLLATDGAEPFFFRNMGLTGPSHFDNQFVKAIPRTLKNLTARNFITFFGPFLNAREFDIDDDRTLILAYRPDDETRPPEPPQHTA